MGCLTLCRYLTLQSSRCRRFWLHISSLTCGTPHASTLGVWRLNPLPTAGDSTLHLRHQWCPPFPVCHKQKGIGSKKTDRVKNTNQQNQRIGFKGACNLVIRRVQSHSSPGLKKRKKKREAQVLGAPSLFLGRDFQYQVYQPLSRNKSLCCT